MHYCDSKKEEEGGMEGVYCITVTDNIKEEHVGCIVHYCDS